MTLELRQNIYISYIRVKKKMSASELNIKRKYIADFVTKNNEAILKNNVICNNQIGKENFITGHPL